MRRYENIFITYADSPEEEIQALSDRYKAIIESRKGVVVKIERWGKRKLAYEIKKVSRGFYVLIDFVGKSDVVDELERNLKIDEKILKFMTVKTKDEVDMLALEKEMAAPSPDEKPGTAARKDHLRSNTSGDCSRRNTGGPITCDPLTFTQNQPRRIKTCLFHQEAQDLREVRRNFFTAGSSADSVRTPTSRSTTRISIPLREFVTERGKIMPRRITGNCSKHQRALTLAIKRARTIALLPFIVTEG